jgi:hypothetical protein
MDGATPHEHLYVRDAKGNVIEKYIRELDANGKPVGPWKRK